MTAHPHHYAGRCEKGTHSLFGPSLRCTAEVSNGRVQKSETERDDRYVERVRRSERMAPPAALLLCRIGPVLPSPAPTPHHSPGWAGSLK